MKKIITIFFVFALIACSCVFATDRYVSQYGTNDAAGGYTNWAGAATNIQDAVVVATNGETVWVTNGTYYIPRPMVDIIIPANRSGIIITNAITLRSVNGAVNTIIDGNYGVTTGRCVFLFGGGVVDGFTLRKGRAWNEGYAAPLQGGGVLIGYGYGNGTVRNCIITSNYSQWGGGGVMIYNTGGSLLENCIISYNTHGGEAGGGITTGWADGSIIRNCLITMNTNNNATAGGGGANIHRVSMYNCTIVSNSSLGFAGGLYVNNDGSANKFYNNIIYYNTSTNGVDNYWGTNGAFANNCTFPAITGAGGGTTNNITNAPSFRDLNNANYRLGENSPCINTGTNQSWMTNAVDLDGNQRIRYGFVDMGAYEYIRPAGTIFIVH